ncbi:MAG: hypothetical protein H6742_07540 [Alphaproteobacteria bacterium]|nr:hypothetical protein [Alphaproteobacteria bacterium]
MAAPHLRYRLALLSLLAGVALFTSAPADAATPEEQAEAVRLTEDMKRLARRQTWRGVDESYRKLEPLLASGVEVTYDDHVLGAEAASQLGDLPAAYTRLRRARDIDATEDVVGRIKAIEQTYGEVKLTVSGRYKGDSTLAAVKLPFGTAERQAITQAVGAVSQESTFEGLLPHGDYTFGPKSFSVKPDQGPVVLSLEYEDGQQREKGLAFVGPRIDVGPAFTVAGEPSADAGLAVASGFSGAGARAGAGLQVGWHSGFGILAEVGYHGLFGGQGYDDTPGYSQVGSSLQAGYGWLAGTFRLGDLDLALGPTLSMGAARGTTALNCSSEPCTRADPSATPDGLQPTSGSIMAAGGSLSVSYLLFDVGPFRGGVGVQGGAFSDSTRMYPWGQIGLTLAPARRDG